MLLGIKRFLINFLNTQHPIWGKGVDLGCGWGEVAPILRNYIQYLIGVDSNELFLAEAQSQGYDELILSDVNHYVFPENVEVIFFFDVIEHLTREDGKCILDKFNGIPNVLLTTPILFYKEAGKGLEHMSHWTEQDFLERGYYTTTFYTGIFFGQPILFAFKGVLKNG